MTKQQETVVMPELLPCPFCGGPPKPTSYLLFCGCPKCGTTWPIKSEQWNHRANTAPDDLAGLLEGVPHDLKCMTFYRLDAGGFSFTANCNKRTKQKRPQISGKGKTPTEAIRKALEGETK